MHPHNPDDRIYSSNALILLLKRARYHAEQADIARDEYNAMSDDINAQVNRSHPDLNEPEHLMVVKTLKEKDLLLEQAAKRQEFHARECMRLDNRFQIELIYRRLKIEQHEELQKVLSVPAHPWAKG